MDWLSVFLAHLASQSGGALTAGTNLFRSKASSSNEGLVVVVSPTPGLAPDLAVDWDRPRIQIACRAPAFALAWQESLRLYNYLRELGPVRLGSSPNYVLLQSIRAQQTPFGIGRDAADNEVVVCNYQLEIQKR